MFSSRCWLDMFQMRASEDSPAEIDEKSVPADRD
jgi:hypothetical protein